MYSSRARRVGVPIPFSSHILSPCAPPSHALCFRFSVRPHSPLDTLCGCDFAYDHLGDVHKYTPQLLRGEFLDFEKESHFEIDDREKQMRDLRKEASRLL